MLCAKSKMTVSGSNDEVISKVCKELFNNIVLKEEQLSAVRSLLEVTDVLAVLPTGFGKSVIFRVFAEAKSLLLQREASILVISSLVSIVQDQMMEARSLGISCCTVKDSSFESPDIAKLIFSSAEEVANPKFQKVLKNNKSPIHNKIELIVVDESHTVDIWTESAAKGTKAFRKAYGELSMLRSLCKQGTPVLALTGTADPGTSATIISKLAMNNPSVIKISPNRQNLRFSVKKNKKEKIMEELLWLVKIIEEKSQNMEKTIIFCSMMNDIAAVVNYLMMKLGPSAYSPKGSKNQSDCLIGIFHSSSWMKCKNRVLNAMKGEGKIRIVVASTALSMGVNFPNVRFVINFGPPRSLLDFHQQAGRAGHDNLTSHVITIYHGHQLSHCEEAVKHIVNSVNTSCVRVAAYCQLDADIQPLHPGHQCCLFCSFHCCCEGEGNCKGRINDFEKASLDDQRDEGNHVSRPVSQRDKDDLKAALDEMKMDMSSSTLVGDTVSTHGFSSQLIDDVVENCSVLFTVGDILNACPVFSLAHAIMILEIIQDIFNDIPNFDESMNMIGSESTPDDQTNYLQSMLDTVAIDHSYLNIPEDEEDELPEVWS